MSLLLTLIKWSLMGVSILGVGWFVRWWFVNEYMDQDNTRWFRVLQFLITIAGAIFLLAGAIWIFTLPIFLQSAFATAGGYILLIFKWPLMFFSFSGVLWVIHWLYWDTTRYHFKDESTGIVNRLRGSRAPIFGVQMLVMVAGLFLLAIFYQLPHTMRETLIDHISTLDTITP